MKENKEEYMGKSGGKKGKGNDIIIISKNESKKKLSRDSLFYHQKREMKESYARQCVYHCSISQSTAYTYLNILHMRNISSHMFCVCVCYT